MYPQNVRARAFHVVTTGGTSLPALMAPAAVPVTYAAMPPQFRFKGVGWGWSPASSQPGLSAEISIFSLVTLADFRSPNLGLY
jgi:hypothetical protein